MKFECGMCDDGDYAGLNVLSLAECMMNSSWDFPSFAAAVLDVGDDDAWEFTMHPTIEHAHLIAAMIDLDPDSYDDFVNNFPLSWDT